MHIPVGGATKRGDDGTATRGERDANCVLDPRGERGANCVLDPRGERVANCVRDPVRL